MLLLARRQFLQHRHDDCVNWCTWVPAAIHTHGPGACDLMDWMKQVGNLIILVVAAAVVVIVGHGAAQLLDAA